MKFNNKKLLIDNYRKVLSNYSVDIQDIVRNAILDDVDITKYIEVCKDNPFRLDQIRLGIKENIDPGIFNLKDGYQIYRVRKLNTLGVDISVLATQLKDGSYSHEYAEQLITWTEKGLNQAGVDLQKVPKFLLELYDKGMKQNLDMSVYTNVPNLTQRYLAACMVIQFYHKPVTMFLKPTPNWNPECLEQLSSVARLTDDSVWNTLISEIDSNVTPTRLNVLISLAKNGVNLSLLQRKSKGKYVYNDEVLEMVLKAYESNIDYEGVLLLTSDPVEIKTKLHELQEKNWRRLSGRVVK